MKPFILFSYLVTLSLAFLLFLFFQLLLKLKKKSLGNIRARWSTAFNLSTLLSWLIMVFLILYFLWCAHQIAQDPRTSDGHYRLMYLILLLSISPLANVFIGSEGIIIHLRLIPWRNVQEKKIIHKKKRRYLEIREVMPSSSKLITRKIPLPQRIKPDTLSIEIHDTDLSSSS